MSLHFELDPSEFDDVITAAVDTAIRRFLHECPRDDLGQILFSKAQAAKALGVSQSTVDRLRKEQGLPSVPLDGRVMFLPATLAAWTKSREVQS